METNLALAFVNETQCDLDTAYSYLQSNHWDTSKALESWRSDSANNEVQEKDIFERTEGVEVKKLSRGISRATDNVNLVSRARCEFAQNFKQFPPTKIGWFFTETPDFSFTLPDLCVYGDEFRKFLEKDLIENSTLVSLEQSGRLNWWADNPNGQGLCQRLWPLATTGDGNCLLHAASLAIWGYHDRLLTLRRALHTFLENNKHIDALYRRWRWQQTKLNEQSGFVYSEAEWIKEWQNIVNMASTEPRRNGCVSSDRYGGGATTTSATFQPGGVSTYESLEEIHVLALAHVLRRPIVVVADVMLRDMNNEPFAPIPFGGIYLPLECSPKDSHRSPLLLTYDMAHFSALVAMENSEKEKAEKPYAFIPLTDSDGMLLPVQFSVDPGSNFNWYETYEQSFINSLIPCEKDQIALLKKYLDVVDLSESDTSNASPEIDSEDEIEKRFIEVTDLSDGESTIFGSKNRAAKQLQSVARQFGSIGKSMSKKLKKNFGSITKVAKPKKSDGSRNRILCAEIHTKRHEHHDQMIKNYLLFAQKRFLQEQKHKLINTGANSQNLQLQEQALLEGPLKCINVNCDSFGTVLTSYMCDKCYETQRNEELLTVNTDSRFGTGRSKFYRDPDMESYDAVKKLPVIKGISHPDRTLYLSKSTFYYDNGTPNETPLDHNNIEKKKSNAHSDRTLYPSKSTFNYDDGTPNETPIDHNNIEKKTTLDSQHPVKDTEPTSTSTSTSTVTHSSNNGENFVPDNNANKKVSEVRHISKFDFGNINQNVNNNTLKKDELLSKSELDDLEYECNNKPNKTFVGSSMVNSPRGDSLNYFMEKKRINDSLRKDRENGTNTAISYNHNLLKSSPDNTYRQAMHDLNENKSKNVDSKVFLHREKRSDSEARPITVSSNSYDFDFRSNRGQNERPKTIESHPKNVACSTLQNCKTNHCTNLASAHTDFYCTKCNKDRKVAGISM